MRNYVYTHPALKAHAGRFVWLMINVENDVNNAFMTHFPIQGLPTLLVIEPESEEVALKWLGSLTVDKLIRLFDDAELAVDPGAAGPADEALAQGDRAFARDDFTAAAAAYGKAVELGGEGWSRRSRALDSWIMSLNLARDYPACVRVARRHAPSMPRDQSFGGVVANAFDCALSGGDEEGRRFFEPLVREALGVEAILADDRSSLYGFLCMTLEDGGAVDESRALAREWLEFLEKQRRAAPDAAAASTFDSHLAWAAVVAGQPERAIPGLKASEAALPDDYNPPARLALIYAELKRFDEALAASDRALARVYGPRRVRVLRDRADIYRDMGKPEEARRTLEEALEVAESFPEGQRSERMIADLKHRLDALNDPSPESSP